MDNSIPGGPTAAGAPGERDPTPNATFGNLVPEDLPGPVRRVSLVEENGRWYEYYGGDVDERKVIMISLSKTGAFMPSGEPGSSGLVNSPDTLTSPKAEEWSLRGKSASRAVVGTRVGFCASGQMVQVTMPQLVSFGIAPYSLRISFVRSYLVQVGVAVPSYP